MPGTPINVIYARPRCSARFLNKLPKCARAALVSEPRSFLTPRPIRSPAPLTRRDPSLAESTEAACPIGSGGAKGARTKGRKEKASFLAVSADSARTRPEFAGRSAISRRFPIAGPRKKANDFFAPLASFCETRLRNVYIILQVGRARTPRRPYAERLIWKL